ncbi:kinesin-like protein KIN-7I isoform X3 [Nematostella vectensis]|uniref:kinesin-like protein KIN-7I isoform X3 n=1 Tax=Nematostella vectensis TaxID=45351 RepID=UPI00207752AF|nr:kinesin-like protein KIN-7I isoform X3 [Nematostella vectensis]
MVRPAEMACKGQKGAGKKPNSGQKPAGGAEIKVGKDSGRVKVFVRVRPMRTQEQSRKEESSVEVSELHSKIHVNDPKHSWEKDYPFDHVFPSGSTNVEVCNTLCKPIVASALNGFNGTLMAYGQTGSGKTYTLMAPDGITYGVVDRCFRRIMKDDKHDYKVSLSYLQIYQEKIYDLLNSTNKVELTIREHPQKGIYVENLSEFVVRSPSEVHNLITVGRKRLVFAETKMNRTSSRSHSVLTLCIERTLNKGEATHQDCVPKDRRSSPPRRDSKDLQKLTGSPKKTLAASSTDKTQDDEEGEEEEDSLTKMALTDDVLIRGRIHLCDLAGSERLKKTHAAGDRLSEAQHINSSLLELGNVIHALAEAEDKKTHVPFRNSTLTRLLQESLGGNCKTSLIVCVSPCISDVSETKSTLNFGSRAMKITNTAYVNLEVDYKRLSDDLSKLLDSKDKDIEDLKSSYENRIDKIKQEAELQLSTAMAQAQIALSSARGLYESQESSLRDDLSNKNMELAKEKELSTALQNQLSSLSGYLYGGVSRTKGALLAELLSMQLFYTVKDLPDDERRTLAKQFSQEHPFEGDRLIGTKANVLKNTDKVLKLFRSYLQLLNKTGKNLNNLGFGLEMLQGHLTKEESSAVETLMKRSKSSEFVLECIEDDESLLLELNKTDDDKAVESSGVHDHAKDELNGELLLGEGLMCQAKALRDALMCIRTSLDGDAVEFLQKAFGVHTGSNGGDRKAVYNAMKEFLQHTDDNAAGELPCDKSLPVQCVEMALLEQSLCQVLVDKALQSSLLLLDYTESQQQCDKLVTDNATISKELEIMKIRVDVLSSENNKLNSKLSETSTFLKDVKTSKTRLESDLSSIFQLYNMRPTQSPTEGESANSEAELDFGISSLVEENAKLKVELKDINVENEELQSQLELTKEELTRVEALLETYRKSSSITSSTPSILQKSPGITVEEDMSQVKHMEEDLGNFLFYVQEELAKIERNQTAIDENSQQREKISNLRDVMTKRVSEEWSIRITENCTLKKQVADLIKKLESERKGYEQQIKDLKAELEAGMQARIELENELLLYSGQLTLQVEALNCLNDRLTDTELDSQDLVSGRTANIVEKTERTINENGASIHKTTSKDCEDGVDWEEDRIISIQRARSDSLNTEFDDTVEIKKDELLQAEKENDDAKAELESLKRKFLELGEELAHSGKYREELEKRFEELVSEKNVLRACLEESRNKCAGLHDSLDASYSGQEQLEAEIDSLVSQNDVLMSEVKKMKASRIATEKDVATTKTLLYSAEVKNGLIEKRLKEKCKKLEETANALKRAQESLKQSKEEFRELHDAYIKMQVEHENESDRESLVEVKLNSHTSDTPRGRIQSISAVSRARAQARKQSPKKRRTFKVNSPRHSDRSSPNSRNNSLSRRHGSPATCRRSLNSGPDSQKSSLTRVNALVGDDKLKPANDCDEDNKLKNELMLAKEQLVRLKSELTSSNIQTTDIGSQLSCLRDESNKLEAELTSMKRAPQADDKSTATIHLEVELSDWKDQASSLQSEVAQLKKDKAAAMHKVIDSEEQMIQLRSRLYKTEDSLVRNQDTVKLLSKENTDLRVEIERLRSRLSVYASETAKEIVDGNGEGKAKCGVVTKTKWESMMEDKKKLQSEIEELSKDKLRLQDMQSLVRRLVSAEDEKINLKQKLRLALENSKLPLESEDASPNIAINKDTVAHSVITVSEKQSEDLYVENMALRCEVDALKIYISNLENELKSLKFKLSVSETTNGNTSKKVLGTLLASAKHEREELRETLNEVYSEKEDTEEELNVERVKSAKLQRELVRVCKEKEEMDKELKRLQSEEGEGSLIGVLRNFMESIGVANASERDIKEMVVSLIASCSQQRHPKVKQSLASNQRHRGLDHREDLPKRGALRKTADARPNKLQEGPRYYDFNNNDD